MDVGITFAGIEKVGSDTAASSATATVAVADASALFGTWTGHLTYTVEVVEMLQPGEGQFVFTVDGTQYLADEGMTWMNWLYSSYSSGSGLASSEGAIMKDYTYNVYSEDGVFQDVGDTITSQAYYTKQDA